MKELLVTLIKEIEIFFSTQKAPEENSIRSKPESQVPGSIIITQSSTLVFH
jgi:hypothetical protein